MKVMKIMNNIKLLAKPYNNKNYNNTLGTIHIFLIRNFFIRNSQMANELSVLKTKEVKKLITFIFYFFYHSYDDTVPYFDIQTYS